MDDGTFARGFLLGLSIAAVLGPVGVLCIRRTLGGGFSAGFFSGLGVATADGLYAAVAAFGITLVMDLLVGQRLWLRLIGGAFLVYLGFKALRSRPAETAATAPSARGLAGYYASTLAITLANPMTILSFAALFAGLGLGTTGSREAAVALVLGTFVGSLAWWFVLATAVSALRSRLTPSLLRGVNVLSGLVIAGFGAAALLGAVAA